MSSQGIRAGRAFIEFGGDNSPLIKVLDSSAAKLRTFGFSVAALGAGLFGTGSAALGGLFALAASAADVGDTLGDISDRTGLATDEIGFLRATADDAGSSFEQLESGLRKFERTAVAAGKGSKEAVATLQEYGITAAEVSGLSPFELLLKGADAIEGIRDPVQKAVAAMELFGKSGASLIPVLAGGASAVIKAKEQYAALGLAIGDAAAKQASFFDPLVKTIGRQFGSLRNVIGSAAADVFAPFVAAAIPALASTIRFVEKNKTLVGLVVVAGGAVAGLGAGILALGVGLYVASIAAAGLSAALSVITAPARIVLGALAGVVNIAVGLATGIVSFGVGILSAAASMVTFAASTAVALFNLLAFNTAGIGTGVIATALTLATSTLTIFTTAIGGAVTLIGTLITIVGSISAAFIAVAGVAIPAIFSIAAAVVSIGATLASAVIGTLVTVYTPLLGFIAAMEIALVTALSTVVFAISPALGSILLAITSSFGLIVPLAALAVAGLAVVLIAKLVSSAGDVANSIGSVFSSIGSAIAAPFRALGNFVVDVFATIGRAANTAFSFIASAAATGFDLLKQGALGLKNVVASVFASMVVIAKNAWASIRTLGVQVFKALSESAGNFKAIFGGSFSGIRDAVKAGDLELAGKVALAGFAVGFAQVKLALLEAFKDLPTSLASFVDVVFDGLADLASGFADIGNSIVKSFSIAFAKTKVEFARFIYSLSVQLENVGVAIAEAILSIPGLSFLFKPAVALVEALHNFRGTAVSNLAQAGRDLTAAENQPDTFNADAIIEKLEKVRRAAKEKLKDLKPSDALFAKYKLELDDATKNLDALRAKAKSAAEDAKRAAIIDLKVKSTLAFGGDILFALRGTEATEAEKQTGLLRKIEENTRDDNDGIDQ